ncbi:MAG: polyprenol monophosphomannose synthase, partial [Acidimicrobiales bacterium]
PDGPEVGPVVSVVVPTYNEADNLPGLVAAVEEALAGLSHEIIVVDDDSPDGTAAVVTSLTGTVPGLRLIHRTGERGLSSAVLAGMAKAQGQVLAVLDADRQHDEAALPRLVAGVLDGADICLGSRHSDGGSVGSFGRGRRLASSTGAVAARVVLGVEVTDPMSGFFAVSRARYEAVVAEINPRGFKILLEFLARGQPPTVAEAGYRFRSRRHGETKLSGSVVVAYLAALAALARSRITSPRAVTYATVALLGTALMQVGTDLFLVAGLGPAAAVAAAELATLVQFAAQDTMTFPGVRRRRIVPALGRFHLVALPAVLIPPLIGGVIAGWLAPGSGVWGLIAALVTATLVLAATAFATYLPARSFIWDRGRPSPERRRATRPDR